MGMPQPIADWTVERVLALPDDGNRYEVVDGELLVSPAPSLPHQVVIAALARLLHPFVTAHGLGCVLHSPADIEFDERTLVQPDLFVAPLVQGHRPRSWKEIRQLLLAIEVLSPSSARGPPDQAAPLPAPRGRRVLDRGSRGSAGGVLDAHR
jgi:Uma2 family endonuclease